MSSKNDKPPTPPKQLPLGTASGARPDPARKPVEPVARPMSKKPVEPTAKPIAKPGASAPEKADKAPEPRAEPVMTTSTSSMSSSTTSKPRAAFVEPSLAAVDALDCEALAICLASDVRPLAGMASYVDWRMCGRLSELVRKGIVTGASREKVLVPTLGMIPATRIFLFGWGPQKGLLDGATERFAWMVDVLTQARVERVAVALPEPAAMLLGLVDDHVRKPLASKCAAVFGPDQLLGESKDTRPIVAPSMNVSS